MASRTIFTDIFRASYVHLKEPYAHKPTDKPARRIKAMFPKSGVGVIAKTGVQFQSSHNSILQALREVTQEEWGFQYDPATIKQMGVQFPPEFQDGDMRFQKDANDNPIPGLVDPVSAGYYLISFKNEDIIGVVGPDGKDIDPGAVYSGCWCRAQIEVSAYKSTQNNSRIMSIKVLNVQMAYDDEAFGREPVKPAAVAFAGMAITNTNIAAGTGQVMAPIAPPTMTPPVTPPVATAPVMAPPAPPALPVTPPPVAAPAVPVYVHTATDATEAVYRNGGWTTELLVQHGKGRMETPAPAAPAVMAPPAPVVTPPPPAPAAPALPVTPPAPPVATVPLTGKVIMKPGSQYTYEQLIGFGWNDDQIIAGGYATPNFTNPA